MNKETKKIINDICPLYKEYGSCERCNTELDTDDEPCYYKCVANVIISNGYCKASEVFEEIETILDRHSISYLKVGKICGEHYYDGVMQFDIAELKKKYEVTNNEQR